MRKNMRAVAAALVVLTIGALSVLAQSEVNDPFADDDPFGPPQPRTVKLVKKKTPDPFADAKSTKKKTPPQLSSKIRSLGIPTVGDTPVDAQIRRALNEKTQLQFEDAELGEVVNYLKTKHEIEIQLDKEALEEYDLGSDTPVTCIVKDISLRSALRLMLREHDLTYIIKNEVLMITTEDVAQENRATRIYDVADLVTYRDDKGEHYTDYEPLIEVLTMAIEPESWMCMGGSGTITGDDFGAARVLVAKHTEDVHAQIASILIAIRNVAAHSPSDGRPPLRSRPKNVPMKPMAKGAAKPKPNELGGGYM